MMSFTLLLKRWMLLHRRRRMRFSVGRRVRCRAGGAHCLVALDTLRRFFDDSSPFALAAKRDAALVLVQVAQAGGFSSVAAFFQSCYDAWCRALLPYQGWLS